MAILGRRLRHLSHLRLMQGPVAPFALFFVPCGRTRFVVLVLVMADRACYTIFRHRVVKMKEWKRCWEARGMDNVNAEILHLHRT